MKLFVGVDLHKHQMTVCIKSLEKSFADIYWEFSTKKEGYVKFRDLLIRLSQPEEVEIAVESTGNTRYFKRELERYGFKVHVVNTLKFKVINESINKTDKHDARTLAEFLSKELIPEVKLCKEDSKNLRDLLKHRSVLKKSLVTLKNQIHGILLGIGIETKNGQLNTKKGRTKTLEQIEDPIKKAIVSGIIKSIDTMENLISEIELELSKLTEKDEVVRILRTIPGCGFITSITLRAYIDDINKFSSYKKLSSYCGLVPWVQNSADKERYGGITKRGSKELRTAFVQVSIGMIRIKKESANRYVKSYKKMKKLKGSGKAIIATSRKLSKLVWVLLKNGIDYDTLKAKDLLEENNRFVA